jgi:hypothetical protein
LFAIGVGCGITVTLEDAEFVHPFAPVPVTIYVVLLVGDTVIEVAFELVFQV